MNGNDPKQKLPPTDDTTSSFEPSNAPTNMPENLETNASHQEDFPKETSSSLEETESSPLEEKGDDLLEESTISDATFEESSIAGDTIQDESIDNTFFEKNTNITIDTANEETVEVEHDEMPFTENPKDIELTDLTTQQPKEAPSQPIQEEPTIDFNFLETDSRWLLKVIAGPNSGAEFSLHGGSSYLIGTDAAQCDIIFHDMSISRKHAKITIDAKENASIEDIDSKNGMFIDGKQITSYQIKGNVMVTLGTTTFVLVDRTQEQKTIFAPKSVAQETAIPLGQVSPATIPKEISVEAPENPMESIRAAASQSIHSEVEKIKEETEEGHKRKLKKILRTSLIATLILLILVAIGIGATSLFQTEIVKAEAVINPNEIITNVLKDFPGVRFSYNPTNKHLLLVGHVLTAEDQTRMLDMIQQLPFIDELNSSGVVIDEFVWSEINQILTKNPAWRGIAISSPEAGKFVLSGFLKTRAMNEELLNYLSQNFAYMNLLEQKVIIEEDLLNKIKQELAKVGCQGVKPSISNGELVLTGAVSFDKKDEFEHLLEQFRALAGIRAVQSQVIQSGESQAIVDITGKYHITGYSQQKGNVSVVVNGRIIGRGDILDGMLIVDITSSTIFLEHDGVTYKIDYIK